MKEFVRYILVTVLLISCKDEFTICDLPVAVRMKCSFYHGNGTQQTATPVPFLTARKLSSPDPDYALSMISNFSLALNPIADSVQYEVSIRSGSIPDTVTFVYTSQKINVSAVCGDIYVNNLTKVSTTMNTLDSAKISSSSVNATSGENVRIYF